MSKDEEWTKDDRLQALAETRSKLAAIEREWKHWRDQSKTLVIELITEDGLSVLKASELSGHHRNSIKIWLDLWNAEKNAARPKK
jgi:hypothetical protein